MQRLRETIEDIRASMPMVHTIGCFARIEDVGRKSDEELRELARLGVSDISIGAESGLDDALAFMRKGHTAADIVEQCRRLDEAGITYDLFYLAGIAGAGRYEENVRATVDTFGKTNPKRIMIHTLTLCACSWSCCKTRPFSWAPTSATRHPSTPSSHSKGNRC